MKPYNRIVFVAESGTCRAPMAAGIFREYSLNHPVEVLVRGLVVLFLPVTPTDICMDEII